MSNSVRIGLALSSVALACVIAGCASPQGRTGRCDQLWRQGGRGHRSRDARHERAQFQRFASCDQLRRARRRATRPTTPVSAPCSATSISPRAALPRPKPPTRTRCRSIRTSRRPCSSSPWCRSRRARTAKRLAFLQVRAVRAASRPITVLRWRFRAGRRTPSNALRAAARACRAPTPASARISRLLMRLPATGPMRAWSPRQDLAADQVDARIQQWMKLAKPARASDQVAALTGVASRRRRSRTAGSRRASPGGTGCRRCASAAAAAAAESPVVQAKPQPQPQPQVQAQVQSARQHDQP